MTIRQARQILGKLANNISDVELERDIKVAELLKNLYFQKVVKEASDKSPFNKSNYGKT